MILEELRLHVAAAFINDEVFEIVEPDGSTRFEINAPGLFAVIFWEMGTWALWCAPSRLEADLRSRILGCSAHQLIAARRRRMETADAH